MDWGNELLCTNCQPWGQPCWAPVAPVAGRAQGLVWDRRTPRGWSRAGVCGEIPALLLLCPSLALWGNRTYKQWSSLKLKPCKAKHEKILLFLPFLGAIAHPKKISGTWETSRARNGGGAGGWRGWQTPTVLLKNMEMRKAESEHTNGFCCSWMRCAKHWWQSSRVSPAECRGVTTTGGVCLAVHGIFIQNSTPSMKYLHRFNNIYIFSIPCIKEKYTLFQQPRKNCNLLSFKESSYSWKQLSVHVLLTITFYEENKH